jgi:hypothetical protein
MIATTFKFGGLVMDVSPGENDTTIIAIYGGDGGIQNREISFPNANITNAPKGIQAGDLVLFWQAGTTGWHVERGYTTTGYLTANDGGSSNTATFTFNGLAYPQAIITRDNMRGANDGTGVRNSQFWTYHSNNNLLDKLVIMWSTELGHPFGYTYAN